MRILLFSEKDHYIDSLGDANIFTLYKPIGDSMAFAFSSVRVCIHPEKGNLNNRADEKFDLKQINSRLCMNLLIVLVLLFQ